MNRTRKILIIFSIIVFVLLLSIFIYFYSHSISSKRVLESELLNGIYVNHDNTKDLYIYEDKIILSYDGVVRNYTLVTQKENILECKSGNEVIYILRFEEKILYIESLKEYFYFVEQ